MFKYFSLVWLTSHCYAAWQSLYSQDFIFPLEIMLVGRKMNLLDAFDFCSFSYTSRWKMTIMKARQPFCLLSRSKRLFQGRCPLCSCQGRLWSLCSGSSVAVAWHVLFLPIPLVTFSTCVVLLCHLALKLCYITEFCSHFLFIYGSFCKGLKFYCNGKHFLHFLGWVFLPWQMNDKKILYR